MQKVYDSIFSYIKLYFCRYINQDQNIRHHHLLYVLLDLAHNHRIQNHIAARQYQKYYRHPSVFDFVFVIRAKDQIAILATRPIY